jgi:hypothetical protein
MTSIIVAYILALALGPLTSLCETIVVLVGFKVIVKSPGRAGTYTLYSAP